MEKVEIIIDKVNLKNYTLILGFPDMGLSGSIAAEHLQSIMDMKEVGHIQSELLPPVSIVEDGLSMRPISIYISEKKKLVLIKSYLNVSAKGAFIFSKNIVDWAAENKIKEIICFSGVISEEELQTDPDVYLAVNNPSLFKKKKNIAMINKQKVLLWTGSVYGLIGQVLLDSYDKKILSQAYIVETQSEFPDARAAGKMLETLCSYLGIKIDLTPLMKEAESIEEQVKALMDQASMMQEKMEASSGTNLMYR